MKNGGLLFHVKQEQQRPIAPSSRLIGARRSTQPKGQADSPVVGSQLGESYPPSYPQRYPLVLAHSVQPVEWGTTGALGLTGIPTRGAESTTDPGARSTFQVHAEYQYQASGNLRGRLLGIFHAVCLMSS